MCVIPTLIRNPRIGKMMNDGTPLTLVTSIDSDTIPLNARNIPYQQWDRRGGALPESSDVELFAPVPERAADYSQGYQMIHGPGRARDEEDVEWDMTSDAYAGIVEPADGKGFIGNSPSALSSTATVHAPVPSRPSKSGEILSQLETHESSNGPDVLQTPTQGTYAHSHSQDDDHMGNPVDPVYHPGSTDAHA